MLNPAQLLRIDLNLLVLFMAVLDEEHVARAANKLNVTPSAVSHGLRRLRRLLQDPLFLKTPKGVKPTERALALAAPIAEILARIDAVISESGPFDPKSAQRRFLIGAPDAILADLTSPLLAFLEREAPGVDIRLVQLMPQHHGSPTSAAWDSVLAELDAQKIDLVVLPIGEPPPRFASQLLFVEDFVVTARKGHPFTRDPSFKNYLSMRHMLVSAIGDAYGVVDHRLAEKGLSRRVVLTVPNFMMALAQLAESNLIATLPRNLVNRFATRFGLEMVSTPFPWRADPVRTISSKSAMQDAGVAWMFEATIRCLTENKTQ